MGGVWDRMRYRDIDDESTWQAFRDNLEFVWEDAGFLMKNMDRTVAITADHGNCFGMWATYGHGRAAVAGAMTCVMGRV